MINKTGQQLFLTTFVLASFAAWGCTEVVNDRYEYDTDPFFSTDPYYDTDPEAEDSESGPKNLSLRSCFASDYQAPGTVSGEGAEEGDSCELTADCLEPLLCIEDICVSPGPWDNYCDGINVLCSNEGMECINFQCVDLDDRCRSNVDCPAGYECGCVPGTPCLVSRCQPADEECKANDDCADGQICDFGSCADSGQCSVTQDLRGDFSATSVMHLGVAGGSAVGGIIDATQWIRDLLGGGGGFPGLSEIITSLARSFLMYNIQDYQFDLVFALIDLPEILDEVQLQHQITLDASCGEMYRGELTIERIELSYQGQSFTERPENIPAIGPLPPAEFGAVLQCQRLAIDEFRIEYLSSGAVRYATDVLTQTITEGRHQHLEDALASLIDCASITQYVTMALGNRVAAAFVEPVCNMALENLMKTVTASLVDKPSDSGWMKIQGEADIGESGRLENGNWFGNTVTGDFKGELNSAQ